MRNVTRTTFTTEARHLVNVKPPFNLVAVEGVRFDGDATPFGLPVEDVTMRFMLEDEFPELAITVWHDQGWMFSVSVQPDDRVTWNIDDTLITPAIAELPAPPSRAGKVRVHGTWKAQGEVDWAPNGHPIQFVSED